MKNPHDFCVFLGALEDTEASLLGFHYIKCICMSHICPYVHMFKISDSQIEYKSAKNPTVINVFIGVVEDTGSSLLEFYYMKSI